MRASVVALVLLLPTCASAQAEGAYQARVREAVAEFDAHRFEEARALFRQAHAIAPSARTLRGIGLASFEMGDYVEAFTALGASLTDARRPLTETQRPVVTDVLDRARRFVGLYSLTGWPSDVVLTVDGLSATRSSDGRLVLSLGTHTVSAHAPDHQPAEATVIVVGGEDEVLPIEARLVARAPTTPTPTRRLTTPAVAAPAPIATRPPDDGAPVAALVTGGVLAAAAVVVGVAWWLPRDQEAGRCISAGADCFNLGELTDVRDAAAATTLTLATLGAVGLATGAALLATRGADDSADVACVPAGAGAICVGRF